MMKAFRQELFVLFRRWPALLLLLGELSARKRAFSPRREGQQPQCERPVL